jgi:hypothetical protein
MLFFHGRRQMREATATGTMIFIAAVLSGCGNSGIKTPQTDASLGGHGGGLGDGGQGSGGVSETGGTVASGGTIGGSGGTTGQGTGGATAAGGATGTGGLAGKDGGAGMGAGGATKNGGATGSGGVTGKGGTAGTAAGGATSTGGKATGGSTGSGGGTGGIGGTGGGTGATLVQPLTTAFCAAAKSCCGRESYPAADLADCESKFLSRFRNYPLVGKGTVTIDETKLAACIAAYNTAATACTISPIYSACSDVFVGKQTEGQACGSGDVFGSLECKKVDGSAVCYWGETGSDPSITGLCTTIPHGKSGDECEGTCATGDSCMMDILGGTPPFPATCFETDGLYCARAKTPAVCKPIRAIDSACTSDTNACGTGNYCDWTTNTCQVAMKLGEPCADASCVSGLMCGKDLKCIEPPFADEYICKGTPPAP